MPLKTFITGANRREWIAVFHRADVTDEGKRIRGNESKVHDCERVTVFDGWRDILSGARDKVYFAPVTSTKSGFTPANC